LLIVTARDTGCW